MEDRNAKEKKRKNGMGEHSSLKMQKAVINCRANNPEAQNQ